MKMMEFFRKWKQGIKDLSPERILESEIVGTYGVIFGMIVGFTFMVIKGAWYFIILGIFLVWLQIMGLLTKKKQLENIIEVKKQMEMIQNENKATTNK